MRRPGGRTWPAPAGLAALVALALLAGCGDPDLWARYQAERSFWQARRMVERLQLNPRLVTDRDYATTQAAFEAIAHRWPASEWAQGGRGGAARDVAIVSGRAAIAVARLEDRRGRDGGALDRYSTIEHDWRAIPAIALEAATARAKALERLGRTPEALKAWSAIASEFPLVDPESGEAMVPVLDAPLRVARAHLAAGERANADSVLAQAERRYLASLEHERGRPAATELWMRLSEARGLRGALDPALEALREALRDPGATNEAPRLALALAQRSLDGGRADSALAYAAWAEHDFGGRVRGEGLLLAGRAWEARREPDSALAAYQRFLDFYSQSADLAAQTRFRRGMILEGVGRWDQAVTEYRVLAASQPTHELGFAALQRIVGYHAEHGETDLARLEGKRALETVDRLIATQRDESVLGRARRARGELLLAMGEAKSAFDQLRDLWLGGKTSAAGAQAGLRAAAIAAGELHDAVRARALYKEVASQSASPEAQREARAALERLRQIRG